MITKEAQVVLNTMLSNLRYFDASQYGKVVERKSTDENNWDGDYEIIKLKEDVFGPEVYIKVVMEEDSYGGEDYVTSIQFVQPKPKEVVVTDFVKIS